MKLVIISGPPGAGKTTIAHEMAKRLDYAYISKDVIKEKLYDTESRSTHDYLWYDKQATARFFDRTKKAIADRQSVIIESNFVASDRRKLLSILNQSVPSIEIYCTASGATRLRRYVQRNETKARHAGHHDRRWYGLLVVLALLSYAGVRWPYGPLSITTSRVDADTTDFAKIDYNELARRVRQQL